MQRGRVRTNAAPPFPGTSGLAAAKSAGGKLYATQSTLTSHSQGARNDEGWRNRSSALGKAFRSGGTERCYGAGGEEMATIVAVANRWSALMPQPND